jgi:hypothetical protein
MSWFDNENEYYQDAVGALRQGDLVLAPTVVLEPGECEAPGVSPTALGEERSVQVWKATKHLLPEAPTLKARVRWDLAMVLPHDCALEKEFNERVGELVRNGTPEDVAIEEASVDRTLDRLIAVAPIRAYEETTSKRKEGIRTGQRHGAFPVPASPTYCIEPGWVDLTAPTTLDRGFFSPNLRLASLTDRAADYLRASLARHWAYRDLARTDEISKALGRTIVDIKAAPMAKDKLRVELFLDGEAGTITLDGSSKPAPPQRSAKRSE